MDRPAATAYGAVACAAACVREALRWVAASIGSSEGGRAPEEVYWGTDRLEGPRIPSFGEAVEPSGVERHLEDLRPEADHLRVPNYFVNSFPFNQL